MLSRRRISSSGNEVSKSGVIGRTISPNRRTAVQRGPMNHLQQKFPSSNIRYPKSINTDLNFDPIDEGKRVDNAPTWSSNRIGPRPPIVRGGDTTPDLVDTRPRADQLKKYLETLGKSAKNVEGNGTSPDMDESQSLSVFSLSSDESEEKKSTVVDNRKKVSYIKTNYMREVKEEEPKPITQSTNLKTTQNTRISEALLKAQQFSNKYKQLKIPQSREKQEIDVVEVAKEVPLINEESSMSSEDEPTVTKDTPKSSSMSSIKSLMNVKDLMLDLPSTSPESKLESHQFEDKDESIKSENYESDVEVKTESSSKIKSEISSEKLTNIEPSERISSSISKHDSESVVNYSSDFEKSAERDQSTQKSEVTSERDPTEESETTSETESETVVSLPKTVKKNARSTVRNVKTATKTEGRPSNVHLNRSTQTMTTEEFDLNNFYNNFNYCSPSVARPYVCYFDPRLISSTIITTDAIHEISTRNPNVILIDDMLKQQMVRIRSMIESQRRNYVGAISTLKPSYQYTTWEDTQKIIENHSRKKKQAKNNG